MPRSARLVLVAGLVALVWPAIDYVRWHHGLAVFNH